MSKIALLLITTAVLSWCQEDSEPKPTLSNEPLTAEQVAVYSAFLKVYDYGSDTNLNVANVTDPLDLSMFEMKEGRGCLKGIFFGNLKQARSVVHRMDSAFANTSKITLVDPEKQSEVVKENDPQKALLHGEKDLDKAVDTAFATGLFTFSEIVFDKKHTWAVMAFSFHCGRLCGHGGMVVLHKANKEWKVTKRECDSWIS